MTLSSRRQDIVQQLLAARRSNTPWPVTFDDSLTVADGYAIQAGVAEALGWFPNGVPAWKVGGKTVISAAPLPAVLASPATWSTAGQRELVLEAELAFRLARAPLDAADIVAAIGTVCVSIELVATRLTDGLNAPAAWKTADQGLHAGLVIGAELPYATCAAFTPADWARQDCRVLVNGQVAAQTHGTHPTGDPLSALPWLVDHAAAHTGGLRAGDVITTGAWIVQTVRPGDTVDVAFGGFGTARVTLTL